MYTLGGSDNSTTLLACALALSAAFSLWLATRLRHHSRRANAAERQMEQRIAERTATLAANQKLLSQFVQHVPVAVAMLDRNLHYLRASERWCKDHHLDPNNLVGRSHYAVFPDLPPHWKDFLDRCLAGEVLREEEESWQRADGSVEWLRWEVRPWGDEDGKPPQGVIIFAERITERKQIEHALRETEATTRLLLENAAQAILAINDSGSIVLVNRMAETIFAAPRTELLGQPIETLIPDTLRPHHVGLRNRFFAHPKPRPVGSGRELSALTRDGRILPVQITLGNIDTHTGPLAVAFISDITPQKEAEQRLRDSERQYRALAVSLIHAQEDERRRVARELHDDVTQRLAFLSIEIGKAAAQPPADPPAVRTLLAALQRQARHTSADLRRISHGLHPAVLEHFGLPSALEEFCEEFSAAHTLPVAYLCTGEGRTLYPEAAAALYRVAQECLRNIVKHSRATHAQVQLHLNTTQAQLTVSDNGIGFPAGQRHPRGLGVIGMEERIRIVNGTLRFDSTATRGLTVTATVPQPN